MGGVLTAMCGLGAGSNPIEADLFMVAGGGAGGVEIGAGGGAGGVLVGSRTIPGAAASYAVVIGSGGAAGANGINGNNTTFLGLVCYGGGGAYSYTETNGANPGNSGGSGGGGAGNRGGTSAGGAATQTSQGGLTGHGYAGGIGKASGNPIQPAGGGGAGSVGQDGINTGTTKAGDGGLGIYNAFKTGGLIGYAGGGSGFSYNCAANPTDRRDQYGGGVSISNEKTPGVVNTGGGGGGAGFTYGPSQGAGGSGIVIIRYKGGARATGGTITSYTLSGQLYTVHTFTGTGTFSVS